MGISLIMSCGVTYRAKYNLADQIIQTATLSDYHMTELVAIMKLEPSEANKQMAIKHLLAYDSCEKRFNHLLELHNKLKYK